MSYYHEPEPNKASVRWHVEAPRKPNESIWWGCASDGTKLRGYDTRDYALVGVANENNDWRVPVIGENNVSHVENIMRPDVRKFFAREDVRADVAKLRANGADHFLMMVHTEHGLIAWRGDDFCTVRYDYPHRSLSWGRKSKSEYSTHSVEDVYREGRMLIEAEGKKIMVEYEGIELRDRQEQTAQVPRCGTCHAWVAAELDFPGDCVYCSHRLHIDEKQIQASAPVPEESYGDVGPWDARDALYEL